MEDSEQPSGSGRQASGRRSSGHLSHLVRYGYGLGTVLNDLSASMWFTYLLLFFQKVLEFDAINTGIVFFLGQISDALATPFVRYLSDKGGSFWLCIKYGRRKSWHLIGTLCIMGSFPFIFLPAVYCSDSEHCHQGGQMVYYAAFVVIFQFGWAATQISHLSMIPDITPSPNERTGLAAVRYSMTVASNIFIYVVTWVFLRIKNNEAMVGQDDVTAFRNIMLLVVSLGALSSLAFHFLVKLDDNDGDGISRVANLVSSVVRRMGVRDWLKEPQFYQVAGIYVCTRLYVNLTQAFIPLYLQVSLKLNAHYVAIIPLAMFLFGLLTSTTMKTANHNVGRRVTYIGGALVGIGGCVWIRVGCSLDTDLAKYEIFGVAAFIGAGGSTMLITSLSLTADLIAQNVESNAFVYASMSLADKLSNGILVILIQNFIPFESGVDASINCRLYYRDVLFYVCGGAALVGILMTLSLWPFRVGERHADRKNRLLGSHQHGVGGRRQRHNWRGDQEATESSPLLS